MGQVAVALVRRALYDQLDAHRAPGGVLEGVVLLPEPPVTPEDLYGQSRKVHDGIWLVDSRSVFGSAAQCGNGIEYQEVTTHTLIVQTTRQDSVQGTQAEVDRRSAELLTIVLDVIGGDPSLGINLAANDLRMLQLVSLTAEYNRATLESGGTDPGHGAFYIVTVEATSQSLFTAPALP